MTRAEFAMAVRKMVGSGLGTVSIKDYDEASVGRPYRMASLNAEVSHTEGPALAASWLALAVDVVGYFTVHTSCGVCALGIGCITVDLDQAPTESGVDVPLEAVLTEGGNERAAAKPERKPGDLFITLVRSPNDSPFGLDETIRFLGDHRENDGDIEFYESLDGSSRGWVSPEYLKPAVSK